MSRWPNMVRTGTIKMPLAIPSIPPSALAPSDTAKSHSVKLISIGVSRASAAFAAAGKPRHEPDLIAAVMQLFVVDRLMSGTVRGAFDQKDRTARFDT